MISQALQHCPGLGPVRLAKLQEAGVQTWHEAVENSHLIPDAYREGIVTECQRCIAALEADDIHYLIERISKLDKWRVLAHYFQDATFFDIETVGLNADDPITVIVSWCQGKFQIFVEHENLDDFLVLLDQVKLLVSFNGSTFDVPRVLDTFHIPELPCPHLDLRWTTYHHGLTGGLKEIALKLGIQRPDDLRDITGAQAVLLWQAWEGSQDQLAREHLIRYCAADVLLLYLVASELVSQQEQDLESLWDLLPAASGTPEVLQKIPPPLMIPSMSSSRRQKSRAQSLLKKKWLRPIQ